jgi:type II secretory pathway pseudopilin PulG
MTPLRVSRQGSGFTLVEALIVLAVAMVLLLIGFPALQNMILQGKMEGAAQQASTLLRSARFEALKSGGTAAAARSWTARVVVKADFATDEIVTFVDLNDGSGAPRSDLLFNPVAGAPAKSTDYELGRFRLPSRVHFWGPSDAAPEGAGAVDGWTGDPAGGGLPPLAVFRSDGSIEDAGALRLGDERGNRLEVRVSPEATARVEVRKLGADGVWRARGDGGKPWEWKT